MRVNTQSGNVVSSHSSACGASSLTAKLVIDSRSASCSSLKMKCLRVLWKSGFSTLSAVAAIGVVSLSLGAALEGGRQPTFEPAGAAEGTGAAEGLST